jgi:hypothetical protein
MKSISVLQIPENVRSNGEKPNAGESHGEYSLQRPKSFLRQKVSGKHLSPLTMGSVNGFLFQRFASLSGRLRSAEAECPMEKDLHRKQRPVRGFC